MDNIRATIKTLFSQINSNEIVRVALHEKLPDPGLGVTESMFCQKFMVENKCYTTDQVCELYKLWQDKWMYFPSDIVNERWKNIFNILLHFTKDVLIEKNNQPICQYNQLLRWRMLTHFLSEDLFTTAFIAEKDVCLRTKRDRFDWNIIIGHDNACVNAIVKKGVTDLHFHLRGSSLNYELNWLCLMNYINGRQNEFHQLYKCLSYKINTMDEEKWDSFYLMTVKACAIRCYLYQIIQNVSLQDFFLTEASLYDILESNESCLASVSEKMAYFINRARFREKYSYGKALDRIFELDYAIPQTEVNRTDTPVTLILSGERKLMYGMFYRIYSHIATPTETMFFYVYLIQKTQIRKELIQLNEVEGFNNFADYEHRKELFMDGYSKYQKMVVPLAIHSAFAEQGLLYLECRISPKLTAKELVQAIRQNDRSIQAMDNGQVLKRKYYYILHFIKQKDEKEEIVKQDFLGVIKYRHHDLRKRIRSQAYAILTSLKSKGIKERIAGIDAANSELYCRPEVFGPVFRFLKEQNRCGLGFTFHVGEDFWDVADGLRAIDEAILFLDLKGNDRLGHALALGIDVKKYYKSRNNKIVMTKQNWMDNAMWMYYKARELGINMSTDIAQELEKTFDLFYDEIYLDSQHTLIAGNEELLKGRDINVYHQAWLLRGDDPECYQNDLEHLIELLNTQKTRSVWYRSALYRNENVNIARKHKIAFYLYHLYQFDANVRKLGAQRYEKELSMGFINLVEQIQEGMKKQIAHMHLCVEANLTSNLSIGGMRKYSQHPITNFYKKRLHGEGKDPHSISVSINTDDKGLFDTTIEEEYALIALALEKEKDEDGITHKYSSWNIYEWLDDIREIGWTQRFKQQIVTCRDEGESL